ncbi:MAG: LCP family protein [Enterococcus sp.]
MSTIKKVIIAVLAVLTLIIVGVSAYTIKIADDASKTVDKMNEEVGGLSDKAVDPETLEPFSILLLGVDTGDLGRTEQGRSDTIMVATVNPKEHTTTLASVDRDIYTSISGYGTYDKINAAYSFGGISDENGEGGGSAGGVEMAINTVEDFLDIPIDHYATINLKGLKQLIDAVGGIEVNNKIDFTLEGVHVPAGKITLDGETGLAYARMRDDDPEGDVGRQRRQREVLTKVLEKLVSFDSLSNYEEIFDAIGDNTKTDLTWDEMITIATNYTAALDNIEELQISGQGVMMNNIYYQMMGYDELLNDQNQLKEQLDIEPADTLPNIADPEMLFYDDSEISSTAGTDDTAMSRVYPAYYFPIASAETDDTITEYTDQ